MAKMTHFQLDKQITEATRMDSAIQRGPMMRWQRKALEQGVRSLSLDNSLNTSSLQGPKSGHCLVTPGGKTPNSSKTPLGSSLTPSSARLNVDRLTSNKTPNKGKSPGTGKTPTSKSGQNTPHHTTQSDRFIPNRSGMDMEASQYALSNAENLDPSNPENSPTTAENQRKLAIALKGQQAENSKILAFKQKAPKAEEGYLNNLKVLYSGARGGASTQKTGVTRHIPQAPDRILDAPELLDDFYLNVLSWSSNNHIAVALGQLVYLWNAGNGTITQLMELDNPEEYVCSMSWIKEGNILGVGKSDGTVQLWDVAGQKLMRTMCGHASRVGCLSWNSYILSSGSRSGAIHHHDVRIAEHHVGTLAHHSQEVCGLAWSPDGKYLASGANDNLLNVWDGSMEHELQPLHSFTQHQAAVKAISWCPWQSSLLASGGGTADRHIRFWNVATGACVQSVDTNSQVSAILWSKEHKELVSGHGFCHYQLSLWKYPSMSKVADLHGHQARILCLAQSPDGSTVASAAADETLRLWKCWGVDKQKKPTSSKTGKESSAASLLTKGLR